MEGELLINMVTRAVTAIMSRLNTLSNSDVPESKVCCCLPPAEQNILMFQFVRAVNMKVFRDVKLCSSVDRYYHFVGAFTVGVEEWCSGFL
jgi:hypothetical protein